MWNKLCYMGIPWWFIWFGAIMMICVLGKDSYPSVQEILIAAFCSIAPCLSVWGRNRIQKQNGKMKFGLFTAKRSAYDASIRMNNLHPPADKHMLTKNPREMLVFGKQNGKYVGRPFFNKDGRVVDGHCLIVGPSGSGKSVLAISNLVSVQIQKIPYWVLDIKGELYDITAQRTNPKTKRFCPPDRDSCGFDPFYKLDENSSFGEILDTMQTVANSLIPLSADELQPFFKINARALFTGMLLYFFDKGCYDLITCIEQILSNPVQKTVELVVGDETGSLKAKQMCMPFHNMAEETISCVYSEITVHIQLFAVDDDLAYAFRDNPDKLSPAQLNEGYMQYICIPEHKLDKYSDVLRLIINMTLHEMEQRTTEQSQNPVLIMCDEMTRVLGTGKIDSLLSAARTLRSRGVILYLIAQTLIGFKAAYSDAELQELQSNMVYKIVLGCNDPDTADMLIKMAGKFNERKYSYGNDGNKRSVTTSYEQEDILTHKDLTELPFSGELIFMSPYSSYNRVEKTPYYKEKWTLKYLKENA